MATRLLASLTTLALVACSSQKGTDNQVATYGGASGAAGTAGSAGASGAAGDGGSSGAGIAGIGGGISTEGGTSTDAGEGCAKSTATARAAPAVLELVVDTSGSMNQRPPNGTQTKWVTTRDALVAALGTIPDGNALGLFFYPGNAGGASCIDATPTVPIAVLDATHRQTLTRSHFESTHQRRHTDPRRLHGRAGPADQHHASRKQVSGADHRRRTDLFAQLCRQTGETAGRLDGADRPSAERRERRHQDLRDRLTRQRTRARRSFAHGHGRRNTSTQLLGHRSRVLPLRHDDADRSRHRAEKCAIRDHRPGADLHVRDPPAGRGRRRSTYAK